MPTRVMRIKQKINLSQLLVGKGHSSVTRAALTRSSSKRRRDNCLVVIFLGLSVSLLSFNFIPIFLVPVIGSIGGLYGYIWRVRKNRALEHDFMKPYPSVLMGMAASLKIGFAPLPALERAVRTVPDSHPLKIEISHLLHSIGSGLDRHEAIERFASDYDISDLDLFRGVLKIVLEEGGRMSTTLEKLALAANDRAALIEMAKVSTTSMRLTSNVLLLFAPIVVGLVATRTDDYIEVLINHPTANLFASIGLVIILGSNLMLRAMSEFRP